jgi:hypothetical protein
MHDHRCSHLEHRRARRRALELPAAGRAPAWRFGRLLRGSFDAFSDRKATHMLSALRQADQIVLGHLMVDEKSNEIPAAPELIEALGLKDCLFTLDAEHAQKNIRARDRVGQSPADPGQGQPTEPTPQARAGNGAVNRPGRPRARPQVAIAGKPANLRRFRPRRGSAIRRGTASSRPCFGSSARSASATPRPDFASKHARPSSGFPRLPAKRPRAGTNGSALIGA